LQPFFDALGRGHVRDGPYELDGSLWMPDGACDHVQVLHRAVGKQNPVLNIPIVSVGGLALQEVLDQR
jgi:hypothetical protein